MADKNVFDRYLLALRKTPLEEKTEHTDRTPLETLLQAIADETESNAEVQHEPKRVTAKGAPDFKVRRGGLIIGYVENKQIDENLDKVLKSEQIKKYQELSKNIILTDYLHFIWISENGIQREILCHSTDLENPKFKLKEDRVEAVAKLLQAFFSSPPEGINSSQRLALELAKRSRLLRDFLTEELVRQERREERGKLYGLFEVFRQQIFHELELKGFADAFAQMLAYGLFLARLNSENDPISLSNARDHVPGSFQLIRELVEFLPELTKEEYRDIRWVVEEVLSIVNGLQLADIQSDLSFRHRKAISRKTRARSEDEHRLFERDPFIYFYEDYLKAYDKEIRETRGVYYTPPPVVNFIVRATDYFLKEKFNIFEGVANSERVTVLDFACGTGTFLLEIFQKAVENIGGSDSNRFRLLVRQHLLANIFGFEYLIAPYAVAHLKLSQYLKEQGYQLSGQERVRVFLTNTLEPIEPQQHLLLPAISAEVEEAQEVKNKSILVITGNPPYFGLSKNRGPHATASVERYKYVDGAHFNERKHWLLNDYVKFLAFAEHKIRAVEEGMIAVITDNSYLDNPTFRGMRQSLLESFDQIYVVDLHGNVEKKETPPSGFSNENVFEIKQGVSICFFLKNKSLEKGVFHYDLWGSRQQKYEWSSQANIEEISWDVISPRSPYYFLKPFNEEGRSSYKNYLGVDDIFRVGSIGVTTSRDGLVVAKTSEELRERFVVFTDQRISNDEVKARFKIGDNENWSVAETREIMRDEVFKEEYVRDFYFGPFDIQKIYLDNRIVFRPRFAITKPMMRTNIALLTTKIARNDLAALVTNVPAGHKSASRYDPTYVFPLFVLTTKGEESSLVENFEATFRENLEARYKSHYSPEEIMGYIYAVLNSQVYRARYSEYLRVDFPRIPFPERANDFEKLSELGWSLVDAHLLRRLPRKKLAAYQGNGDNLIEYVRYSAEDKTIAINKAQFFKPVSEEVWNFHIGGHQVLDKYLKSRKERQLSLDEINHVSAVADSLAFTVEQMVKIDKAYKVAFPDRG